MGDCLRLPLSEYGLHALFSDVEPVLSPKDHLSPPVNLAKETVLKDFAGRTGLTPPKVFLDSGLVSGGGVRVPIWVWADFA